MLRVTGATPGHLFWVMARDTPFQSHGMVCAPTKAHPRCHIPSPHRHDAVCMINVEQNKFHSRRRLWIRRCWANDVFRLSLAIDAFALKNPLVGIDTQMIKCSAEDATQHRHTGMDTGSAEHQADGVYFDTIHPQAYAFLEALHEPQ